MQRTVIRQILVAATAANCWQSLTRPKLVAKWFADVEGSLLPGRVFEFHFGDGDFFSGSVDVLDRPSLFQFRWQFMATGVTSRISFHLFPLKRETEVTVIDQGDYSHEGALELREGWDDFLGRFQRAVTTGVNARYRWSEVIGTGTVLPLSPAEAVKRLSDKKAWAAAFPGSQVKVIPRRHKLTAVFHSDQWNGRHTTAHITLREVQDGARVSVVHKGWNKLAGAIQFAERKRFARHWADFFREIHQQIDCGKNRRMAAQEPFGRASTAGLPKSLAG